MDKNQLVSLLNHFSGSTADEAVEVNALAGNYPYSQLLEALAARVSKDHQLKDHQVTLQRAAVYSTDRSVLKEIMTAVTEVSQADERVAQESLQQEPVSSQKGPSQIPTNTDYADEVIHDLERLQELKHNFEALFDQDGVALPVVKPAITKPEKEKEEEKEKKISKKERIIQMARELEKNSEAPAATDSIPAKKKAKKSTELDPIVSEIKATRKKVQPESEKTKEQIEIIDQFIKTKPHLVPSAATAEENPDLASTLKSGEFGDHIVSETLAEILIRQGKKDKAIEVYKKLIWKFPQKKAYFAAQIEDLRK
ncbi:MAG: hypothetical protein KF846_17305 [Cyclobacteriaceae bacterium]|nr:hypothetical protein [Cyclobacteriaceae bacterium]